MVKYLIWAWMVWIPLLSASEFTASVDRNPVGINENFLLTLSLKDGTARAAPTLDELKKTFTVQSQQQSSSTMIMNGAITSSTTWTLILTAKNAGEVTIPAIPVTTSEGIVWSQPFKIIVIKGASAEAAKNRGLTVISEVSNHSPYKNEPFFVTTKLISKYPLANVKMEKFQIDDAIVELSGEPKAYKKILEGIQVNVAEFQHIVTPIRSGPLTIAPVNIQGGIPAKKRAIDRDLGSFFQFPGFEQLDPFTLPTEEVKIEVKPAVGGVNPWIPAKELKIEETWDKAQTLQAGTPFVRSFKVTADGIMSHQIPSINNLQAKDSHIKVYADKPELKDNIHNMTIKSSRNEQFTVIPQQAGELILPEIAIAWWDVVKNEKVIARVPSRTLDILPAPAVGMNASSGTEDLGISPEAQSVSAQRDPLLYVLLGLLGFLLLGAMGWGITLQRRIMQLTERPVEVKVKPIAAKVSKPVAAKVEIDLDDNGEKREKKSKKETLPDLNPT